MMFYWVIWLMQYQANTISLFESCCLFKVEILLKRKLFRGPSHRPPSPQYQGPPLPNRWIHKNPPFRDKIGNEKSWINTLWNFPTLTEFCHGSHSDWAFKLMQNQCNGIILRIKIRHAGVKCQNVPTVINLQTSNFFFKQEIKARDKIHKLFFSRR